jgi:hypothetical protein
MSYEMIGEIFWSGVSFSYTRQVGFENGMQKPKLET